MKTEKEIRDRLEELKQDPRNYYPLAEIFSNAPLALIQLDISSNIHALEFALDLPLSKFPLTHDNNI